ncbi:hypothetical protein RRF57_009188 [Xylaria bambusicola]|uniref:Uncharacterized protein n=1 Tax=Xylaria bambusicola TaxID=326684 RepID=A0AAN7UT91_9PEZI
MGHLGVSAGTDCGNDAIETAIGGVVDDPAAMVVLVYLLDPLFKFGPRIKTVLLPYHLYLAKDLLTVGIPSIPLN